MTSPASSALRSSRALGRNHSIGRGSDAGSRNESGISLTAREATEPGENREAETCERPDRGVWKKLWGARGTSAQAQPETRSPATSTVRTGFQPNA